MPEPLLWTGKMFCDFAEDSCEKHLFILLLTSQIWCRGSVWQFRLNVYIVVKFLKLRDKKLIWTLWEICVFMLLLTQCQCSLLWLCWHSDGVGFNHGDMATMTTLTLVVNFDIFHLLQRNKKQKGKKKYFITFKPKRNQILNFTKNIVKLSLCRTFQWILK